MVNVYLVYELDNCLFNTSKDFTIKHFLVGSVKLTRNTMKRKLIYKGFTTAFDGAGS